MRDSVKEIHRSVDRVDDPLVGGRLVPPHPFLPVDGVTGKNGKYERLDECLRAPVELQFDVVRFGGIDVEFPLEVTPDHAARGQCRIARGGEDQFVHP